MKEKKMRYVFCHLASIACQITALCLELFAKGVVMTFGLQEGRRNYRSYSYFSHIVYGYSAVPMITGILTVVLLLLSFLGIIFSGNKRIYKITLSCNIAAVIVSVLVLFMFSETISWISVSVALLLTISCMCFMGLRKSYLQNMS